MAKPYDLDQLRSLVAVARHGTVTEAARALHRSTSAISMQLKSLEMALGIGLLRRHPRGITLTRKGEIALEHAKKILALTQSLEAGLDDEPVGGVIRVGLSPDLAAGNLPRILRDIVEWRQEFELQIMVALSRRLEELLRKDAIDLALAAAEFVKLAPQLTWHTPLVWAVSRDFQLDLTRPLPLALSRREPGTWETRATEALDAHKLAWRLAFSASEITSVITAIEAGVGIGLITADCVRPTMRALTELEGIPLPPTVTFGLFRLARAAKPGFDAITKLIRSAIQVRP